MLDKVGTYFFYYIYKTKCMYTLTDKLYESLLDDEDDLISNNDALIHQFLKDNYKIDGTYTIENGIVDVNGSITLTNYDLEYLTNELFSFGKITGNFSAGGVRSVKIKSLKGAPRIAGAFTVIRSKIKSLEGGPIETRDYNIYYNNYITDLISSPKIVNGDFKCYNCDSLKYIKCAPKKIKGRFDCSECGELISLERGPEIVGGDYNCSYCQNLQSIKGVAKKIGGTLDCSDCTKLLIDEVRKEMANIKCKDVFLPK